MEKRKWFCKISVTTVPVVNLRIWIYVSVISVMVPWWCELLHNVCEACCNVISKGSAQPGPSQCNLVQGSCLRYIPQITPCSDLIVSSPTKLENSNLCPMLLLSLTNDLIPKSIPPPTYCTIHPYSFLQPPSLNRPFCPCDLTWLGPCPDCPSIKPSIQLCADASSQ